MVEYVTDNFLNVLLVSKDFENNLPYNKFYIQKAKQQFARQILIGNIKCIIYICQLIPEESRTAILKKLLELEIASINMTCYNLDVLKCLIPYFDNELLSMILSISCGNSDYKLLRYIIDTISRSPRDRYEDLIECLVYKGNIKCVKYILENRRINVNYLKLLNIAIYTNDIFLFKYIQGRSSETLISNYEVIARSIIDKGNKYFAEYIIEELKKKLDSFRLSELINVCFQASVYYDNFLFAKYFHLEGANISSDNNYAFHKACQSNNNQLIRYLYENGCYLQEGLELLAGNNNIELFKLIFTEERYNDDLFMISVNKGSLEVISYLVDNKHVDNSLLFEALNVALNNGFTEVAKYLIIKEGVYFDDV